VFTSHYLIRNGVVNIKTVQDYYNTIKSIAALHHTNLSSIDAYNNKNRLQRVNIHIEELF